MWQSTADQTPYEPKYFFFYGTLLDPETWTNKLQLEPPQFRKARVEGYHKGHWLIYPALMPGVLRNDTVDVVEGSAAIIESKSVEDKLVRYETENYYMIDCEIKFQDGTKELGRTFMIKGNAKPKPKRSDRT